MIYNADVIRQLNHAQAQLPDGRWVLARPLRFPTLFHRIKVAWMVFKGRYDALEWTGQ